MDNIITETKRSELPDSAFGIPEERKYPLHDEKHVRSAIKLFNHVDQKYEKQLANKIIAKIKEYDITPNIGDNNRLRKYITEFSTMTAVTSSIDKDHKQKGTKSLSDFHKLKITKEIIKSLKDKYGCLKYIDYRDDAYAFFDGDTKLVGIVAVDHKDSDYEDGDWITVLEVSKEYQGYGLGTQLLDFAVKNLHANVLNINRENEVAVRMYEKYGFKCNKNSTSSLLYMHLESAVNKSVEYVEEGYLNQLFMSVPIKAYNTKNKTPINNMGDLLKYHKNPGVVNYVKNCKKIEDLRYIKKDSGSHMIIPQINIIKERIALCEELGECDKTKSYYKGIKKLYLDRGITEKDCDATIEWCKELDKLIAEKISELKKSSKNESTIIDEAYLKNNEDIYYNRDKFDSGEINLCFITGHGGSGKSTMGAYMADNNTIHVDMDDVLYNWRFVDGTKKFEKNSPIEAFLTKGPGKKYYGIDKKEMRMKYPNYNEDISKEFISYMIDYAEANKNKRYIVEGVWLFLYIEPSKLKEYAVYIKGTSALVSIFRAVKRDYQNYKDSTTIEKIKKSIDRVLIKLDNMVESETQIKKYRDYFGKKSLGESSIITEAKKSDYSFRKISSKKDVELYWKYSMSLLKVEYKDLMLEGQVKQCIEMIYYKNKPIGFISGKANKNYLTHCYISNLMILPEYQRKGHGKNALKEYIEQHKDEYDNFFCYVNMYDTNAISFYKHIGADVYMDKPFVDHYYYVVLYDKIYGPNILNESLEYFEEGFIPKLDRSKLSDPDYISKVIYDIKQNKDKIDNVGMISSIIGFFTAAVGVATANVALMGVGLGILLLLPNSDKINEMQYKKISKDIDIAIEKAQKECKKLDGDEKAKLENNIKQLQNSKKRLIAVIDKNNQKNNNSNQSTTLSSNKPSSHIKIGNASIYSFGMYFAETPDASPAEIKQAKDLLDKWSKKDYKQYNQLYFQNHIEEFAFAKYNIDTMMKYINANKGNISPQSAEFIDTRYINIFKNKTLTDIYEDASNDQIIYAHEDNFCYLINLKHQDVLERFTIEDLLGASRNALYHLQKAVKQRTNESYDNTLNESLETRLVHPMLPKKVNIYHGTYSKDFKTIEPTSYNNGTKLSTSRMSSFWFIEMEYAKAFSVMEIINRNKNDDKIPMMLDKNLLVAVPSKYRNHVVDILKNNDSYVYAKKNIESKYLGVGQGKGFPEYTLDVSIKPDSVYTLSYPDNLQYVSFKSDSEIAELKEYYKTNRPSLLYYTADELKQRREYVKGLTESSVEDYLDDDEWDEIDEYTPVSFLSKRTRQAKNKKAHRDYLKKKQKSHPKKYNFFHKHESTLYEDMKSNIIDAEPVFIVNSFTNTPAGRIISVYTHSAYSHTAISLDTSLTHMYSFNADNKKNAFGGFSIESIKDYIAYYKDSTIQVNCIFIKKEDMDKIKFVLDNMTEHIPDTRYGFKNIFNIVLNRAKEMTNDAKVMVCSQFVAYILHNTADIRLVNKSDNLVTPKDLATINNPRVYKLYEGKAIDYDQKKINRIFRKLKTKAMIIKESLIDY